MSKPVEFNFIIDKGLYSIARNKMNKWLLALLASSLGRALVWKPETAEGREKEVSDATFQLDTIDVFLGKLGGHENSD